MQYKFTRLFGLDCIRALAIGLVVLSHCTFLLFEKTTSAIVDFVRIMGAIGVDLFFVLSGYLIGGILLKLLKQNDVSFKQLLNFWKRRWMRTLPNYFLILSLNILVAVLLGQFLPKSLFLYPFFLQNFSFNHPDFFTEAWSLSIEEYAYLLLPLIFYLALWINRRSDKVLLFIRTTVFIIIALTFFKTMYYFNANIDSYKMWSASFRKVVIFRIDSIYFGFIAVYYFNKKKDYVEKYKTESLGLGLFLFGLIHFLIYYFDLLPQTHLWFYTFIYLQVISFSLLLLFPFFLNLKYNGLGKKLVYFISTRSYAIYLVNYSLVLLNIQWFVDVFSLSISQKFIVVILFLSITILLSNVIYNYFEKPLLKYRDHKFPR